MQYPLDPQKNWPRATKATNLYCVPSKVTKIDIITTEHAENTCTLCDDKGYFSAFVIWYEVEKEHADDGAEEIDRLD